MSFHLYFDKQVHKKKINQAKKKKAWILLNQTRTEKQMRAAALQFFFSLINKYSVEGWEDLVP